MSNKQLPAGWRLCEFCKCQTNARQRFCCSAGMNADKANGSPPMGGFNCPHCGKDFPHRHEPDDLNVRPYIDGVPSETEKAR